MFMPYSSAFSRPVFFRRVRNGSVAGGPGIVDTHVEFRKAANAIEEFRGAVTIGKIGRDVPGFGPEGLDQRIRRRGLGRSDDQPRAAGGKVTGDLVADAARRTGNQCGCAFKIKLHASAQGAAEAPA
jgi:hypothetical protein